MTHPLLIPIIAGGLAGLLFLLAVSGMSGTGGFFLVHVPLLPLFLVGWYAGFRLATLSAAVAAVVIFLLGAPKASLIWLGFSAIPALIFIWRALLWRLDSHGEKEWYPLLAIVNDLTLYAGSILLLVALMFSGQEGGLQGVMLRELAQIFETADPRYGTMMKDIFTQWTFLILAFNAWVWVLMLYLMALLAHFILEGNQRTIRPHLMLAYCTPPLWLLMALAGSAVLSLLPGSTAGFIGKTLFTLLLLPYFLAGIALLNTTSQAWPGRTVWLAIIYIFTALSLWPVLFFAAWGVLKQCLNLSKSSSSDTTP